MSGIYIPGMEMPTRCEDCFCYRHNAEYDHAYCNISSTNVLGHGNARLNGCPLIPVPPHGRLIDADGMVKEVCGGCVHGEHKYANCIDCALANAPTIIPASGGTDNE